MRRIIGRPTIASRPWTDLTALLALEVNYEDQRSVAVTAAAARNHHSAGWLASWLEGGREGGRLGLY